MEQVSASVPLGGREYSIARSDLAQSNTHGPHQKRATETYGTTRSLDRRMARLIDKIRPGLEASEARRNQGPVSHISLLAELPFTDIATIGKLLGSLGLRVGAHLPCCSPIDLQRALEAPAVMVALPIYGRTTAALRSAGVKVIDSGPIGAEGTHHWLEQVGLHMGLPKARVSVAQNMIVARIWERMSRAPLDARIIVAGRNGSEMQIARLLAECGAEVPMVCTSLNETDAPGADANWLETTGTRIAYATPPRAAKGMLEEFFPNLVIGPSQLCTRARALGIASLNSDLLVNCPMMGFTGAGPLSELVRAKLAAAPACGPKGSRALSTHQ